MNKTQTLEIALNYALAISIYDGAECNVNIDTLEDNSFDLDLDGEEYDGGTYIIENGNVINVSLPNRKVYGTINSSIEEIINNLSN
jgi:hypothetical protein